MAVLGITSVFMALVMLMIVVSALARLLGAEKARAPEPVVAERTAQAPAEVAAAKEDDLRSVALAAYAYHLRRRVSVPPAAAPSPWLRAGRDRQVRSRFSSS